MTERTAFSAESHTIKMKQSLFSGSLVLLLCVSALLSCGTQSGTDTPDAGADTAAAVETQPTETGAVSGNPADLNLGGETINIWYTMGWPSYTDISGVQTGEVLDDAVYAQKLAVQEKLNCTLSYHDTGVWQSDCAAAISTILLADDTSYDLFCPTQWVGVSLIPKGMYLNIYDMPYLSLDAPWWDIGYMEQTSMGHERLYALVGDCIIDRLRYLSCVYYNKELYGGLFEDPDGLYQTVLDGEWTYETFTEISETVFSDINNNGKTDENDIIGARLCWNQDIMALQFCTGVPLTMRDENNLPYVVANSEKMADLSKKLYDICFGTDGIIYGKQVENQEIELAVKQFTEDRSMFLFGQLQSAEYLRDMETDFGVIPTPKYDTAQEEYYSYMYEAMRLMALPYNCQKAESVCAVLEEMAFEGYTNVTPIYYETVLKNKYARDDVSCQMIDLVRNGMHTDMALVHITEWNTMACYVRQLLLQKSSNYASYYEKNEKITVSAGEKFIESFLENT